MANPIGVLPLVTRVHRPYLALAAILIVAAALRGWNLNSGGVMIPYYLAGVRSQVASWHNVFFNAFDPAGFVSLDKPPIAFWLQDASAKLFGFSTASVMLPQVLEGVVAVGLLYWLVRRRFGTPAGLLAALFLALSPINVAVDRSNNTESCLVIVLLLAAWALMRATETGKFGPLAVSGVLVGVGFNVKMLVAFGVVPALALVYLFGAMGTSWWRRLGKLIAAGVVIAVVSLSWSLACDLIPAADRPFVDSTEGNSMLELAVGHNFTERFFRRIPKTSQTVASNLPADTSGVPARDYAPAGPLRLAAPLLAAQVAWLLPLAVIGGLAAWRQYRGSGGKDWALWVWAGWAAAYGAIFSAAEALFHAYYLAVIAAPLCALAAIGFFVLWQLYRDGHKNGWLLPAALLVTAAWQGYIVQGYLGGVVGTGFVWLPAFSLGAAGIASVMLWWRRGSGVVVPVAALVFLLALPTVWSVATAAMPTGSGFTAARPPFLTAEAEWRRSRFAMTAAGALAADPRLLAFLARNHRGEQFSLATSNARMAAPIIIATGTPVMALGGFNGRAPILKVDAFAELVADGRVRFALIGDGSPGLRRAYGEGHQKELVDWIRGNGKAIDPTQWRSSGAEAWSLHSAETVGAELYDLSPLANGGA